MHSPVLFPTKLRLQINVPIHVYSTEINIQKEQNDRIGCTLFYYLFCLLLLIAVDIIM